MKVTLVNSKYAEVGYEFVHYGMVEECKKCSLIKTCNNLEKGRKYKVIALREYEHPCKVYGKAKVVEVEEPEILSAIDRKRAFIAAIVRFKPICSEMFCQNSKYCNPEGLFEGDKCKIESIYDALECDKGLKLQLVGLKRA